MAESFEFGLDLLLDGLANAALSHAVDGKWESFGLDDG